MNMSSSGLMVDSFWMNWVRSGIFGIAHSFRSLAASTVTNIGRSVIHGSLSV